MLLVPEQTARREAVRPSSSGLTFALCIAGVVAGLLHTIAILGFGRGFEMVTIARNLADHGAFADPFDAGPTGPTAVNPPLYPLLLACWFKIFGNPTLVTYAAIIGNIAANALTAVLLPRVSLALFGDLFPGIFAAFACLGAMQLMPAWDTSYTIAGLVLFCVLSASTMARRSHPVRNGGLMGVEAGMVVLLNPSSLLVTAPWTLYLARRRRGAASVRYCCALAAGICLVVSVWVVRNQLQLGAPVLRTNLGMSVYASNNDCAAASLIEDEKDGCYEAHHPNTSPREAQLLRTLGEVGYDRKRTVDAIGWIRSHPRVFRRLTLRRAEEFWFPASGGNFWSTAVVWLVTAFSIPGLVMMAWRREPAGLFLPAVLIVYPLMYYVVVADVRYRYPVLWISALAAGYFVSVFRSRMRQGLAG